MNAIYAVIDSLKTWPEPPSLELEGKEPLELAEVHSRLGEIAQVVRELQRIVAQDLATKLDGKTLRYGNTFYRPGGRGSHRVTDEAAWWPAVLQGLMDSPRPIDLLAALYPASSVRLTALPKLAAALGVEYAELKQAHIGYAESTMPLSVIPQSKAPQYLQTMEDGEIR